MWTLVCWPHTAPGYLATAEFWIQPSNRSIQPIDDGYVLCVCEKMELLGHILRIEPWWKNKFGTAPSLLSLTHTQMSCASCTLFWVRNISPGHGPNSENPRLDCQWFPVLWGCRICRCPVGLHMFTPFNWVQLWKQITTSCVTVTKKVPHFKDLGWYPLVNQQCAMGNHR